MEARTKAKRRTTTATQHSPGAPTAAERAATPRAWSERAAYLRGRMWALLAGALESAPRAAVGSRDAER